MKNLLSNKTLQATYGGDVIGGSVVRGMLGAFLCTSKAADKDQSKAGVELMLKTASIKRLQAFWSVQSNDL